MVAGEIDLVSTHDADHALRPAGTRIAHGRPEECPSLGLPRSRRFRVHHLRSFDSLCKKANPPIDLPQAALAVPVVGIIAAIAIAGGPSHDLRHSRAFPREQKTMLIFEALQPARRYVVLDQRRGLVRLWLSRKTFTHPAVLPV